MEYVFIKFLEYEIVVSNGPQKKQVRW